MYLINDWVGQAVYITLRAETPAPFEGTLLKVDATGILIELAQGPTFVPMSSILHISRL